MKLFSKIIKYLFITIFSLIIILIGIAELAEDEITKQALKQVQKSITAPIEIGDVSFSLIKRFPSATIEFNDVWIGTPPDTAKPDSIISPIDTIARIEDLFVSVATLPLIQKKYEIQKVELQGVDLTYKVDSQGISNLDFLMDTAKEKDIDTTTTPLNIVLQDLELRDITCHYSDSTLPARAKLFIREIEIEGKAENEVYTGSISGSLQLSDCSFSGTNLHLMERADLEVDLEYVDDSLSINELNLITEGAVLNVSGNLLLEDEVSADIKMNNSELNLSSLSKYIPEQIMEEYGIQTIAGRILLNGSVDGNLSDSLMPHIAAKINMSDGGLTAKGYPPVKNLSFNGYVTNGILNNNQTTSFEFNSFHIETEKSKIDLELAGQDLDQLKYSLTTNIAADLSEFRDFIPDTVASNVSGLINASFSTRGQLPDSIDADFIDFVMENSRIELNLNKVNAGLDSNLSIRNFSGRFIFNPGHFTSNDVSLSVPQQKIWIKNTRFDAILNGKISQIEKMGIDLRSYHIEANGNSLEGSAYLSNLENPDFRLNSYVKLNLREIQKLLPDTVINHMSGTVSANISSSGKVDIDSISSQMNDLIFENSTASLKFYNVAVAMPDTLIHVKDLSGQVNLVPDKITLNRLKGIAGGIEFSIDSTKILNVYNSVIKNGKSRVFVEGRIDLGNIDYSMIAPFIEPDTTSASAETQTAMKGKIAKHSELEKTAAKTEEIDDTSVNNWGYVFKGKLSINSFRYNKALVEDISAKFNVADTLYIVDQFKFYAFGGEHNTSLKYLIEDNEKTLWIKNSVKEMNVNQLLKDFDNFSEYSEPAITHDNITGILTTKVDAQVFFIGDSIIMDKLYARADTIKLEKGLITNYQPVQDVAKYLPGVKNLDILEFKTISSQIFVFQEAVFVPSTSIVSNKLDATALGKKTFGEDYSYHFEVFLSDILTGKSKRVTKKQEEQGDEITSSVRNGILVKSYSIAGKNRSGLDNKTAQEKMRSEVKVAWGLLKVRFHPHLATYNTGVK